MLLRIIAAILVAGFSGSAFAEPLIVDVDFVTRAAERGAILWDVRDAASYRRGHLPGAVNIGDPGRVLREDHSEDYVALGQMLKILGDAGIDPAQETIVYSTRGNAGAYFGLLTLEYLGAKNARVFHGGIEDWQTGGKALTTEIRARPAITLTAKPAPGVTVTTDEVIARMNRGDVQIVDARTPAEYGGRDIRAIRGGHIPGAVSIPYEQNWRDPLTAIKMSRKEVPDSLGMSLKPKDDLAKLYAGLDRNKETIVYCQSGVRAAETAAVLRDMGFTKVTVYDSSWLGFAARLDVPAADQAFLNVGALNGRIGALQQRIEELEAKLAEAAKR